MKKQFIYGFLVALVTLGLFSYRTTEGDYVGNSPRRVFSIPLMQRNVLVTSDYSYMKSLLKKGYVCEDVDINEKFVSAYTGSKTKKYYTMIKY